MRRTRRTPTRPSRGKRYGSPKRLARGGDRGVEQGRLLGVVHRGAAAGGARALGPSDDVDRTPGCDLLDAAAREVTGAHVARFFLRPDDLGVGVAGEYGCDLVSRPGVELLEPHDRHGCVL